MMVAKNVEDLLKDHVDLEVEWIDRLYLNGYIPQLETPGGFASFLKHDLAMPVVSTTAVAPTSRQFVKSIERFPKQQQVQGSWGELVELVELGSW